MFFSLARFQETDVLSPTWLKGEPASACSPRPKEVKAELMPPLQVKFCLRCSSQIRLPPDHLQRKTKKQRAREQLP